MGWLVGEERGDFDSVSPNEDFVDRYDRMVIILFCPS